MKAVIVAAGSGSRLMPMTRDRPKSMVKIGGRPIIEYILDALRGGGVSEIAIVTGHQSNLINYPNVRYYHNPQFEKTNILTSLFCAKEEFKDGFIFSYGDIIYGPDIVRKLLQTEGNICIVVDLDWGKRYCDRTEHPTDEAEFVCVENRKITKISKFMNPEVAHGEFTGLAKFNRRGAEILLGNYERLVNDLRCGYRKRQRFHNSISIETAYLTDMLQELIDRGYLIEMVEIKGGYFEIDTLQDLRLAKQWIKFRVGER